jgi:hypothetical protein
MRRIDAVEGRRLRFSEAIRAVGRRGPLSPRPSPRGEGEPTAALVAGEVQGQRQRQIEDEDEDDWKA